MHLYFPSRHEDVKPNEQLLVQVPIVPYKDGERTLLVDFDCSSFRDIKGSCTVNVKSAFSS